MKKRLLVCLLAISMFVIGIAGCGGTDVTADNKTQQPVAEKTSSSQTEETTTASKYQTTYGSKIFDNVTISVELFDRSNAPEGSTITENKWTQYVNEQMNKVGINVEFVPVPRGDEIAKMQAMMASQTAPDITITYTYAYAEDYYNQGGIWDVSEFIDGPDQALNMKAYLGEDVINIGRNANNVLYGVVAKRATTASTNMFLRKDWMDALGLSVPGTPDELYDVIYKMVNNNPDNRSDVIGAIEWMNWNLRAAFSKTAGNEKEWAIAIGEDALMDYYDKGTREYYRFMNKMYNNGLMHKEYYALTEDNFKSHIVSGAVGFFEANVNFSVDVMRGSLLKTLQENIPTADIISIPALKNINDGKQYSQVYAAGGLINFCPLTANAEKVEACMTYLDWMCTQEGGFVLYHGFEGEHFNYENGVPVVKDAVYNKNDKDWIRADIFLVGNQGYFATVDDFNACTSKEAPGYENHVVKNYEDAMTGTLLPMSTYTSPSTSSLITDINLVRDQYTVQCITCAESDFDATYDEYMKALEDANIKTIIDERTEYFTAFYGN